MNYDLNRVKNVLESQGFSNKDIEELLRTLKFDPDGYIIFQNSSSYGVIDMRNYSLIDGAVNIK